MEPTEESWWFGGRPLLWDHQAPLEHRKVNEAIEESKIEMGMQF